MNTTSVADRFRKACAVLGISLVAAVCLLGWPHRACGAAGPPVLTSVIALQVPQSVAGSPASGTLTLKQGATNQEVSVVVQNIIPIQPDTPPGGLGLWVADSVGSTNIYFVNVLNNVNSNGTWTLDLKSGASAPPQLGVPDVTNLFDRLVVIADADTNVYLQTYVPPFVTSFTGMTYSRHSKMVRPADAPSPKAEGEILVKLNGKRGTSVLEIKANRLDVGDGYCAYVVFSLGSSIPPCNSMSNSVNGTALFLGDTSQGQELYNYAIESNGVVRVDQITGATIEIRDSFGALHLSGIVP